MTFLLVTETSKEDDAALQRVLCIHYLIRFKKKKIQALIDSGSEVNTLTLAYASRIGFQVHRTEIGAQKLDSTTFKIFKMVLASFQVENKLRKTRFFQKTFLLANISMEMVLSMPFLTFSNANVQFVEKELT